MHDLVAVALGHLEGGEHGAVDGIEKIFRLGIAAAFIEVNSEQGHFGILNFRSPTARERGTARRRLWHVSNGRREGKDTAKFFQVAS
jgi:hypothetical protein